MIIQHNVMALNAHRQLGGNNSLVSKNLEKLSSGYRINRAGDDAAGLAVSEKMRAQITGLDRAKANAQDGISLVQTAEGALTEVHSMLNRMVELATQSANGTLDTANTDRQKIQDEVNALSSEIDRISKSTNFNGITLLDGSLGSVASTKETAGSAGTPAAGPTVTGTAAISEKTAGAAGTAAVYELDLTGISLDKAGDVKFTVGGKDYTVTIADADKADASKIADALVAKINADKITGTNAGDFTATNSAGKIELTAANAVADDSGLLGSAGNITIASVPGAVTGATAGTTEISINSQPRAGDSITIGDKTYEFVTKAGDNISADAIEVVIGADKATSLDALQAAVTGNAPTDVTVGTVANGAFTVTNANATDNKPAVEVSSKGGGLELQIGDTADTFNKVYVKVAEMGAEGLGIGAKDADGNISGIKVDSQADASAAIKQIKTAINTVSTNRSKLGALQNRLEHTINNLGVTGENMTAAESRIRDVDMASEMMKFTKNNVLTQAAQAMLAQANQQPQQILQLLR